MKSCERCGRPTRRVVPVFVGEVAPAQALDEDRMIPRSAMSWELNASIPWGEHPDDDRFLTVCEECAA